MPLHTPAVRRRRLGRAAAIAFATATACIAGAATIVIADDQPAPQIGTIAEPSQPFTSRYFDIEANKAASMRALGLHIAEQRANRTSRYQDLEANKARIQRAR
jgi:ABC-type amino acid transport substrate-binding protein